MSKISQKEGVFNAVCEIVGQSSFDGAVELTTEQRRAVIEVVATGLMDGVIELSEAAAEKYDSIEKVKSYTNGLVSNWLRKDTRLNGGERYEAKNPGSRAGSSDPVIRELRKLKSTLADPSQIAAVEAEIEKRMETLRADKVKKVEINLDLIPEDLRDLVG